MNLASFEKKYETTISEMVVKGRTFRFFKPTNLEPFIDPRDIFNQFPLWVKIWEASFVLAEYVSVMEVDPRKRFLEIGCGLGVVGIVASSFGHDVTMTEYNEDALDFARANALLNATPDAPGPAIFKLDWNVPLLEGDFDLIVGSEITYSESDFNPLLKLFRNYLKPKGEIIVSGGVRRTTMEFFRQMSTTFHIKAQKKRLRSEELEMMVILARMRFKENVPLSKGSI
jgi:predicted nicotinamide N-methyase